MTLKELYLTGKKILQEAELDSPSFDALCLAEKCFSFSGRAYLSVHSDDSVSAEKEHEYLHLIKQRLERPLQYILEKWYFCDMELCVGEGVLIPREDTMALVSAASEFIREAPYSVIDLCSGSGAVALAVAQLCKNSVIKAVEISPQAFTYLKKNTKLYGDGRVEPVQGDVLLPPQFPDKSADIIVSNPPYIPENDIKSLAWEVQCEPLLALDGGTDGLDFYRKITELWTPVLKESGMLAFEVGAGQAADVADILLSYGFRDIKVSADINGADRCVSAIKRKTERKHEKSKERKS